MKTIRFILLVASILGYSFGAAVAADMIKIGLLAPLTGFAAADGASVKNSVDLAVEKINKAGGLQQGRRPARKKDRTRDL